MIAPDDPRAADVRQLLERHLTFARSQTPPEDAHALDLDGLLDPAILFFSFRERGELLAIGALRHLDDDHAEVKSMHTVESARGRGIGRAMLDHLLGVARARGYRRVSLETGAMAAFAPARSLYVSAGFVPTEPFGDYRASRNSVYLTLALDEGLTIRHARIEDDAALQAIDVATWSWLVAPAGPPDPAAPFFGEGADPGDVLVADCGRVVGYVRLRHPSRLPAGRHVLQINGVAVDPPYRRRGIAGALLAAAIAESRSRGARRLTLRVFAPNAAARALYDAAGFEVEGVLRGEFFLEGSYVDDVLMALDLSV
jgi:putative acetyltransferase